MRPSRIVNPKLNLIFGPWASSELDVDKGHGFRSNDTRGTITRVDPKTGDPADPVSRLVRATGDELGLRTTPLPGLQTSLSVDRPDFGSELLFVSDAGTTEAGRAAPVGTLSVAPGLVACALRPIHPAR